MARSPNSSYFNRICDELRNLIAALGTGLQEALQIKQTPGPEGPQGVQGIQGIQGPAGTVGTIIGSYPTLADLQAAVPIGKPGEFYYVAPDLYVWDSVNSVWKSIGIIAGPQGVPGIQGVQGLQGIPGTQGGKGDKGDTGAAGKDAFKPKLWQFSMNATTAGSVTDTALLPFDTLVYSSPVGDTDVALNASSKIITIQPGTYQCSVSIMTSGATGSTPTITTLRRKVGTSAWTKTKMLNVGQNASVISIPFFVNYTEAYEVGVGCDGGVLTWTVNTPQARLMIMRVA
jgi:hypothetical protein